MELLANEGSEKTITETFEAIRDASSMETNRAI